MKSAETAEVWNVVLKIPFSLGVFLVHNVSHLTLVIIQFVSKCFQLTQDLELFSAFILPPYVAMFHCTTGNVGRPAYKDQANTDLKVSFTSKHRCTAGKTFLQGQYKLHYMKICYGNCVELLFYEFFYTGNQFLGSSQTWSRERDTIPAETVIDVVRLIIEVPHNSQATWCTEPGLCYENLHMSMTNARRETGDTIPPPRAPSNNSAMSLLVLRKTSLAA